MKDKNVQSSIYDEAFFDRQIGGAYSSALSFAAHLAKLIRPSSVVDLGCGRGAWLKAFLEQGAELAVGYDGQWVKQNEMVDPRIKFHYADLNEKIVNESPVKFELAISVEVAEHLFESSADIHISNLVSLSDVIIFSAACPGQGGPGHINEKPQSYWAEHFQSKDYEVFDIFRPEFWGRSEVEFWYQQNAFLYVKRDSQLIDKLRYAGILPLKNIQFMNCIHPDRFLGWYDKPALKVKKITFQDLSRVFKRFYKS